MKTSSEILQQCTHGDVHILETHVITVRLIRSVEAGEILLLCSPSDKGNPPRSGSGKRLSWPRIAR